MQRTLSAFLLFLLVACAPANQDAGTAQTEATATVSTTNVATTDTTPTAAPATTTTTTANQETSMSYQDQVAELHTSAGEIHIRFFPDVAPNHVKNFIDLAKEGFYDGTKFHRVIPGFMIQGGDPNTKTGAPDSWGTGGAPNRLQAEFNTVPHRRGIVSMARSGHPHSASSQFFIVVADSTFLDNQYTVFGQVTKGMEVADTIVSAQRGPNDRPNSPTTINSIKIRPATDAEKGPAPK